MPRTSRSGRHATTVARTVPVTTVLLLRRARELTRHLPPALAGDERSVHQARVASRRLRETVPVIAAPSRSRHKVERDIRRLTRALGGVRELDVAIGLLDDIARRPQIPRDALEDVRAQVLGERERRRTRMIEKAGRVNLERVHRRLQDVCAEPQDGAAHDWRGVLETRIVRRARVLGAAIEAAGRMYAPERLHDVRIAVKKLRYGLELAADARLEHVRPDVATLKRTQETLGRLHDLQVLQHHVAAVQASPPPREGADDGGLDVIAGVLEEACRHLHARYCAQLPALLDLVARCRAGVPAASAGTRRRPMPVKMLGPRTARGAAARRAG
jgi:CHAD domain-containing protein